jgi:putative restriction endonuclease
VNFWWPGETAFRAIQPGEIFVLRLKSPRNKIGGFGVFSSNSLLPIQMAWDAFGRSNGVPSVEALTNAIAEYRTGNVVGLSTNIGCTILVEPIFLPSRLWLDLPPSWSRNIQRGKVYSTENTEGLDLWNRLHEAAQVCTIAPNVGFSEPQTRYGTPTLITPRLGQGADVAPLN